MVRPFFFLLKAIGNRNSLDTPAVVVLRLCRSFEIAPRVFAHETPAACFGVCYVGTHACVRARVNLALRGPVCNDYAGARTQPMLIVV